MLLLVQPCADTLERLFATPKSLVAGDARYTAATWAAERLAGVALGVGVGAGRDAFAELLGRGFTEGQREQSFVGNLC